jgi:4-hydroxy-3-polyprenylbenzoate decarboxylase
MSVSHLGTFISSLDSSELSRITVPVDPKLEIAAITRRVCTEPAGGRALLFAHPRGSGFSVATNLFGSERRVCRALGVDSLDMLTERMMQLLTQLSKPEIGRLDSQLAELPDFRRFNPLYIEGDDVDLVTMVEPDLRCFPFLHNWPADGSAEDYPDYITLAQVMTVAPNGSSPNCGLYRVQVRGAQDAAIQWKPGSGAARHAELYLAAGLPMPVAIVLGGDPALLCSAMFPLPGELDEVTFAGFLRGAPLATVACHNVPLRVPLGAEVVIEGYVEPGATVLEGPFGNHSGCYSPEMPATLFRVTTIRHRPAAIIPATVVGPPPMEDCWMARVWERLLLAFLRSLIPAIRDIHVPFEWAFHQSAVIFLENPQPGMVGDIVERLWALPWFAASRLLIFTDAESVTPPMSYALWRVINVTEFSRDVYCDKETGRLALDATGAAQARQSVQDSKEYTELVDRRWKEYGFA